MGFVEDKTVATAYVGQAGWSVPTALKTVFPTGPTGLTRYSAGLPAVEINSSFYRPHRSGTYEKWSASVPPDFRFAVKVPKAITHEARLKRSDALMAKFLGEAFGLGQNLGPLLVQLPPSLSFDKALAEQFFAELRTRFSGQVALEPRHESWFSETVATLLRDYDIARVGADPSPCEGADQAIAGGGLVYYRLHGSPKKYFSPYRASDLRLYAQHLASATALGNDVWCIFDNTASGAAIVNAIGLARKVGCWSGAAMSPAESSMVFTE